MVKSLSIWIIAYGLGSIPFGVLFARAQGVNLREHGSGNIGATNVALPFYCFSYAALYINASSMAVINGSTPLFAFLFSMLILGFKFRIIQFSGIVIGLAGLVIFVGFESLDFNLLPILAATMGAAFYGISMVYIYKLNIVDTKAMAAITMIIATVLISPFLYYEPLNLVGLNTKVLFSILFLGIFCTQ